MFVVSLPSLFPTLFLSSFSNGWGVVGAALWAGRLVYLGVKSPVHLWPL